MLSGHVGSYLERVEEHFEVKPNQFDQVTSFAWVNPNEDHVVNTEQWYEHECWFGHLPVGREMLLALASSPQRWAIKRDE